MLQYFMSLFQTLMNSRILRVLLLLAAALHLAVQLGVWLPNVWRRQDTLRDVVVYYHAAREIRNHQPLYRNCPRIGPDVNNFVYLYPPLYAILVAPAARLSFINFARVGYIAEVAFFWIFACALARLSSQKAASQSVLLWGALLGITPGTYDAMSLGQSDPLLWALFGMAMAFPRWTGALLGLSGQIKPFALLVLAQASWAERRAIVTPALLALVAGTALSVAICGPAAFVDWVRWALPLPSQGSFAGDNISLSFAVLRAVQRMGWSYHGGPLPAWAKLVLLFAGASGVVGTIWASRRQAPAMRYSLTMGACLIFAPTCWITYLPIALVPFALWIKNFRAASLDKEPERMNAPPLSGKRGFESGDR